MKILEWKYLFKTTVQMKYYNGRLLKITKATTEMAKKIK